MRVMRVMIVMLMNMGNLKDFIVDDESESEE